MATPFLGAHVRNELPKAKGWGMSDPIVVSEEQEHAQRRNQRITRKLATMELRELMREEADDGR